MGGRGGARRRLGLLSSALGLSVVATWGMAAASDTVRASGNRLDVVFSLEGANPVAWRACHPSCEAAESGAGSSVRFRGAGESPVARLAVRGPGPPIPLDRVRFAADVAEDARALTVTFRADLGAEDVHLTKVFRINRDGYEVSMTAEVSGANAGAFMAGRHLDLDLAPQSGLDPPPAAGVAAMLERVSRVVVAPGGVAAVDGPTRLERGRWAGVRNRFWAILVRSDTASIVEPGSAGATLTIRTDEPGRLAWRYTFYSGPVEPRALGRVDPVLDRLLFSGLWSWLRPLSFALSSLLGWLTAATGNPGLAIVALAGLVKVALLPILALAGRLQDQVDATQARLEPQINAIRAAHRGEERARRTWELYREAGVSPLYTLKSLGGVLVQLPVFIAVFDMLADDFNLAGVPFLWIPDLSRPDRLWRLPGCAPFFGCDLNLLPFLMSGVSLIALFRSRSRALTPSLVRRQRRNLSGVTLLFFLIFYTFPAGMVLYWTSTNAFQLAGQEVGRLWRRGRPAA